MMDGLPPRRRFGAILALSAGTALVALDGAIVTVALPTIATELAVTDSAAVMIVTLYQMVLVTIIMPVAALGDRLGHRTVHRTGLCIHLAGSLLCYLASNNLILLVVGRGLQAVGTAGVLGVTAALVRTIYPRRWLGRGLSANSMIVAVSTAAGPVISGMIIGAGNWQLIFAAAVPACIVALTMSASLPEPIVNKATFNFRSAALSSLAVGLLVISISGVTNEAVMLPSLAGIVVALVLGATFVHLELATGSTYLPLGLLRDPILALSMAGAALGAVAQMLGMVMLPFLLSNIAGITPKEIGLLLAPWPLTMMVCGFCSGVLTDYIWPPKVGTIGAGIAMIGFATMAFLPSDMTYFDFAWRAALCGAGLGIYFPTNGRMLVNAAPPARLATVGSMVSTNRMTAQALGAAIAGVMLHLGYGTSTEPMWIAAGLCGGSLLLSGARLLFHATSQE